MGIFLVLEKNEYGMFIFWLLVMSVFWFYNEKRKLCLILEKEWYVEVYILRYDILECRNFVCGKLGEFFGINYLLMVY